MPKVYVVNFAGHDYRPAKKWGDLQNVTTGYVSSRFDRLMYLIVEGLKDSTPDDWLIPSGMLVANMIAAYVWARKHGELKMLIWNQKEGYVECRVGPDHLDYLIKSIGDSNERNGSKSS